MPVGEDAGRWRTFRAERTVVVAARTVTSTVRALEVLPALLRDDPRVSVVFAYDSTSAFHDGVLALLRREGCRIMPWEQLGDCSPDLIVSASENIDVPEGDCPVLVLPHGVGFHKFVPDSRAPRTRLSGMVADELLEAGRAWLAVSHPDQEEQLVATHPKVAGRTLLVGDPCYDQLVGGLARRPAHRRALGVDDGQRLVVLSSTWGPTSLIGRDPGLPARVPAELPLDAYRVAAIVHPNVWSAHGAWQIRALEAAALDAGLLLIPPIGAWQSALLAADLVIGDHGSVTLYGAALGKPVLLGAFGDDVVRGTAMADLGRLAPRLDPAESMREQVDRAVGGQAPDRYEAVAARAFAVPGQAVARLRAAVYRLLDLSEPTVPAPQLPVSEPDLRSARVTKWLARTTASTVLGQTTVTVERFPVTGGEEHGEGHAAAHTHLACETEEPDHHVIESASVLVRRSPAPTAVAGLAWIRDTLGRWPGSRLTAVKVAGGCLVGLRDGRVVEVTTTGPEIDPGLPGAVVHTLLRAGTDFGEGALVTLRAGAREEDVAVRLRPGPLNLASSQGG
ncbi:hypothetical protein AB0C51_02555 [Streptomyces pathocidini]|uniref:hypothetical protein n=1 Tax=Streptomyces pathocidini TaxID=1650571 RepID=UPI003401663E